MVNKQEVVSLLSASDLLTISFSFLFASASPPDYCVHVLKSIDAKRRGGGHNLCCYLFCLFEHLLKFFSFLCDFLRLVFFSTQVLSSLRKWSNTESFSINQWTNRIFLPASSSCTAIAPLACPRGVFTRTPLSSRGCLSRRLPWTPCGRHVKYFLPLNMNATYLQLIVDLAKNVSDWRDFEVLSE